MNAKFTLPVEEGLCKDCKWRFNRTFIPTRPEEFEDDDGNKILEGYDGKTDVLTINICLLTEIEIDMDITVECSHYGKKEETIGLFRHDLE